MRFFQPKRLVIVAAVAQLWACTPGPEYVKPEVAVPAHWSTEAPWRQGKPDDAALKGPWWEIFGDTDLNTLEQQAMTQSPSLELAAARLEQAKATATVASAGLYPSLDLTGGATRSKTSKNRPLASPTAQRISMTQNDFTLGLAVNYEADVAGRVSSSVKAAQASTQQAQADLENAKLLLAAELASDYFSLRELDAEIAVVKESIDLQRKALEFVTARHDLGAASGLDVAQQQAQLDATLTQIDALQQQRARFEHAIATLSGTPAPSFSLPEKVQAPKLPEIPVALPSDVLQRRPDVASSERAMAAANAQIGVAKAAFYPSVMLSPKVGLESATLGSLFSASSLLWSFGVSAVQTVFDAGRNQGNLDYAQAGYQATVASYKQSVLTAMQEVEDGLSGSAILGRAATNTQNAVASSQRVLDLATARYEGGIGTHLDVIVAQQGLLTGQRQAVQVAGQQYQVAVYLVKALGGGWQAK
jgi:NodT family efflux transporter outer membrane factor (OMF) lipoprotein